MNRKVCKLLVLLIAASGIAMAQFTTVSGTVTDPNGLPYASGTIASRIVASGTPVFTANSVPYMQPTQASGLDSTGTFIVRLADNSQLSPGGSTWTFTVCSAAGTVPLAFGKGPICFTVTGITISGTSQNIGATLTAAAPALTANFGSGTGNVSGAGSANQLAVWTGASTIGNSDITDTAGSQLQLASVGTPLSSSIGIVATVFPTPANCGGSATVPISANPPFGCIGHRILHNVRAGTTSGATAGLSVEAHPTNFVTGTLGVGISSLVSADFAETEERGIYAQAWENTAVTVTTRRGIFGLAVNNTGNTTATNEAGVFQSGSTSGTNTVDYGVHVLAPSSGGTLTKHVGVLIDAQATGVQQQLGTQVFSALPACSATYDGSLAAITDATSATNGTVVAGSGTHHDLIYCNGTSWVVVAGT